MNLSKANELLSRMLNPVSEGLGTLGIMRVGPRTVDLLSSGLMMLMITAVALKQNTDTPKFYYQEMISEL